MLIVSSDFFARMLPCLLLLLLPLYPLVWGDPVVSRKYLQRVNRSYVSTEYLTPEPADEEGSGSGLSLLDVDCSHSVLGPLISQLEVMSLQCAKTITFENCCEPKFLGYHQPHPAVYLMNTGSGRTGHVYCDMTYGRGGWMVIMRRGYVNPSCPFQPPDPYCLRWIRNKASWERGFGKVDRDFWMGLEAIRHFTEKAPVELVIELRKKINGTTKAYFARYDNFSLGKAKKYRLWVSGYDNESSTLPDSLSHSNGFEFKFIEYRPGPDHEQVSEQYQGQTCTGVFYDAWWHGRRGNESCTKVSLFRHFDNAVLSYPDWNLLIGQGYIIWEVSGVKEGFDYAEMKIRPKAWECSDPALNYSPQVLRQAILAQKYPDISPFSDGD